MAEETKLNIDFVRSVLLSLVQQENKTSLD